MTATTTNSNLPTLKQVAFADTLGAERALEVPTFESKKAASAWIDWALKQPKSHVAKMVTAAVGELESGMYRNSAGDIFKVYKAVHGSGKMCAKVLHITHPFGDLQASVEFEYVGLAAKHVTADQRMTIEEAKEFGAIYGVCCVCGATLTDEGSIAAGIGPVCSGKWF